MFSVGMLDTSLSAFFPVSKDEGNDENGNKDVKFFRVTMPDGSTTVVKAKPGTPIKEALSKLCERRTLTFAALEVTLIGQEKVIISFEFNFENTGFNFF